MALKILNYKYCTVQRQLAIPDTPAPSEPSHGNQLCIVHQIRNSCKFVPYKDRKAVCADLKKIYGAVNLDDAEYAKEEFREKWNKKYPNILKS